MAGLKKKMCAVVLASLCQGFTSLSFCLSIGAQPVRTIMPQWYHLKQEAYGLKGQLKLQKLQAALTAAQEFRQADHYPESEVLFSLAVLNSEQNKQSEAEKYLREAIALKQAGLSISLAGKHNMPIENGIFLPAYSDIESEKSGKKHALANCQSWLGRTLLAERKFAEAAAVLEQSIALLDSSSKPDGEVILLPDTLRPYAQALRALNRRSEADKADARANKIIASRRLVLD
ncbi:tetratricopeptide repeat protein [bacterium]|jgi:tetratricopeptide (TPR) repeat protein|nr:tetratricopeptide repeat protein [bacterium]